MTLEQFLTLIATILGAVGSIYVLKSILRLTPDVIKRLSIHPYGHDPAQIDSLSAQKSESVVGTYLIIIALTIAILNAAFTPSFFVVSSSRFFAILCAFVLSSLVSILSILISKRLESHYRRSVAELIVEECLDDLIAKNAISTADAESLQFLAEKYFGMKLSGGTALRDFLQRVAEEVGRKLPETIQIENERP